MDLVLYALQNPFQSNPVTFLRRLDRFRFYADCRHVVFRLLVSRNVRERGAGMCDTFFSLRCSLRVSAGKATLPLLPTDPVSGPTTLRARQ